MKPLNVNERGVFTFSYDGDFFIETDLSSDEERNFIFSDVTYGGEGDGAGHSTIRPYYGKLQDWINERENKQIIPKGQHRIKYFCGSNVRILKS